MKCKKLQLMMVLICAVFFISSCKKEQVSKEIDTVIIGHKGEHATLNPLLSKSGISNQIINNIFYALSPLDPYSFEMVPVIAEGPPQRTILRDENKNEIHKFDLKIKNEATWQDGKPILAADILTTMKIAFIPNVNSATIKATGSELSDVRIDSEDPKKISFLYNDAYLNDSITVASNTPMPRHIYDPNGTLDDIPFLDIKEMDEEALFEKYPDLRAFGESFNSTQFSRETIVGSGPYKLKEWNSGSNIILEKVENWWGEAFQEANSFFQNYPQTIEYKIILDETSAIAALKDGTIDFLPTITTDNFHDLKNNEFAKEKLNFYNPTTLAYTMLMLNKRNDILADRNVRAAIAYAVDYENLLEVLTNGQAQRVTGPFHPGRSYFNKSVKPIGYDLEKAKELLNQSGWTDTNNNGTVDKTINGKLQELELDYDSSTSKNAQNLGLLLQEDLKKIGIKMTLDAKAGSLFLKEMKSKQFETAATRIRTFGADDDPFQTWHSENSDLKGTNYTGFGTPESDELIEKIRSTKDRDKRQQFYYKLQEIIQFEHPAVFLYIPFDNLAVSKNIAIEPCLMRPGYFERNFKTAAN